MHQIGSGMYVSGRAPDRRRERQLSSGSVATPPYTGGDVSRSGELGRMFDVSAQAPSPASSSRRSSGQLPFPLPPRASPSPAASGHLAQLSHSGLLVGPSPSPAAPSPARGGSWRKPAGRRRAAAGEEDTAAASPPAVSRGRARLGVPFACYVLVAVAAVAGVGAGVFFLVAWRRWEVLTAACGLALAAASLFAWNVRRCAAEAERFFRRSPDTVLDQVDMPVGELVKITGTRSTNFYISDRNSGKRFYVRAGEGAKITWMIKRKTVSFDGDKKSTPRSLKNWMASNDLSGDAVARLKEGFIREGDTASVIGVLKRHHGYDVVDAPAGVVATGYQPARCMFPVLVEGLVLIGSEDPDEAVYMV